MEAGVGFLSSNGTSNKYKFHGLGNHDTGTWTRIKAAVDRVNTAAKSEYT